MSIALANETLFPRAAFFALGPADPRMEPGAPAAAEPHTLVLLSEVGEGIPRRDIKRPDCILAHCTLHSPALVRLTSERVYARPAWHGQRSRISLEQRVGRPPARRRQPRSHVSRFAGEVSVTGG